MLLQSFVSSEHFVDCKTQHNPLDLMLQGPAGMLFFDSCLRVGVSFLLPGVRILLTGVSLIYVLFCIINEHC